jgi:dsDNA-specific endonuclease/ATPase MutS2
VRAAKQAKQWAIAATREADQLLKAAKKRAETIERKRQLKKRLQQTARVMKSAGKAAVVAGVAAGIAAARAELNAGRKLLRGKKR